MGAYFVEWGAWYGMGGIGWVGKIVTRGISGTGE